MRADIRHHVGKIGPATRVVIVSNNELADAPAQALGDLQPSVGLPLPAVTAPTATPSGAGGILYIDVADGDLKIRFANGVIKTIATN